MTAYKIFHACLIILEVLLASAYVAFQWMRLLPRDLRLRKILKIVFLVFSGLFIFVMVLRTNHVSSWYLPLQNVVYTWVILFFYLFVFTLLLDVFRLVLSCFPSGRDWKKKNFYKFSKCYFLSVVAISIFLISYGFVHFNRPVVKELALDVDKNVPNLKIVVVSDLHVGTMSSKVLQQNVDRINALHPDMILLLGDQFVVDWKEVESKGYARILRRLNANRGVYAINGNHESYHGFVRLSGL